MERDGDLTGNSDSKAGTLSFWINLTGGDGASMLIYTTAGSAVECERRTANTFRLQIQDTGSTVRLRLDSTTTHTAGAGWVHVIYSWDVAVETRRHLYINGVDRLSTVIFVSEDVDGDADNLDYTRTEHAVGGNDDVGTLDITGCLSEFFFDRTYRDLSSASVLDDFYDASGPPQDLLAVNASPIMYFKGVGSDSGWIVNSGTGGNFVKKGTTAFATCTAP
jgi:hypothetical protein